MSFFSFRYPFFFGYFTDFGLWLAGFIPNDNYAIQLLLVISGIIILGFGITLGVIADVILNSGEAFVKALSKVIHKEFSNVKIAFDISWVVFSIILSLIFFNGTLVGTREGTIISAVFTGVTVKFWTKLLKNPMDRLLKK